MIDYQQLEQCSVFHGISGDNIKSLLEGIHCQTRSFASGDVVALAGEPVRSLFIILSGSVRGEMQREKLIIVVRKTVTLLNRKKLQAILGHQKKICPIRYFFYKVHFKNT